MRMNTKQQQQHFSKWMSLQLSRAEFDGINTNRELKSELGELETKGKSMRWLVMLFTMQEDS